MAEGSAYETEKETGRGKRKRVRNKLFDDTDSDEDIITKRNKKSIPAPPSVPLKHILVRKDIIQNKENNELANSHSTTSFFPLKVSYMFVINIKLNINFKRSSKILILKISIQVCSKSNVFEKLEKRTQEINNSASVNHTITVHESKHSSNRKSSCKNKSPIKETSPITIENTFPQSCVSSLDVDEEDLTYVEQTDTPNKKRQTNNKCRDSMQNIPSSSFHDSPKYVEQTDISNKKRQINNKCTVSIQNVPSCSFHNSPKGTQTRRLFSPLKSGFHQRILSISPAKTSSENPEVGKSYKI